MPPSLYTVRSIPPDRKSRLQSTRELRLRSPAEYIYKVVYKQSNMCDKIKALQVRSQSSPPLQRCLSHGSRLRYCDEDKISKFIKSSRQIYEAFLSVPYHTVDLSIDSQRFRRAGVSRPISSRTYELELLGYPGRRAYLERYHLTDWWHGPTVFHVIDHNTTRTRALRRRTRLCKVPWLSNQAMTGCAAASGYRSVDSYQGPTVSLSGLSTHP